MRASALTVTPGQTVSVSSDRSLQSPLWGDGGFTVQERGSLSLAYVTVEIDRIVLGGGSLTRQASVMSGSVSVTDGTASLSGCTLDASVSLTTTAGGGALSLASMAVPGAVLGAAQAQLGGGGSTLRLTVRTVSEALAAGELTGTMTVEAGGSKTIDPPTLFDSLPGVFTVTSGPCTVSDGGRCVGRPGGYLPNEACAIVVGGGDGVLAACGVFDTYRGKQRRPRHPARRLGALRLRLPGGRGAAGRRPRGLGVGRR